jgi:phosphatidylethanolamine-binding protein (PEBP) family uncharacterized protein
MSYAVTLVHPPAAFHWVIWDIPVMTTNLPEGVMRAANPPSPAGSSQNMPNIDGSTWYGYNGPCPHGPNMSYIYTVYALRVAKLPAPASTMATSAMIDGVIQANMLAKASVTAMASQ